MRDNDGSMSAANPAMSRSCQRHNARTLAPIVTRCLLAIWLMLSMVCVATAQSPSSVLSNLLKPAAATPKKSTPDKTQAANPPAPEAAAQAQPPSAPIIPLPDIAARSQELAQTLQSIAGNLPDSDQLKSMNSALAEREPVLLDKQSEAKSLLNGTPSTLEIRDQENYWRGVEVNSNSWRKQLLGWANDAQSAIQQLSVKEPQWAATRDANQDTPGLEPVLQVIGENLANIRRLRTQAQDELQLIVNMQIRASAQDQLALDVINALNKARTQLKGHLSDRDSLPLWKVTLRRQEGEAPGLFQTAGSRWSSIRSFASENRGALLLLLILWIGSSLLAYRLHQATRHLQPFTDDRAEVLRIVHHWFALGMLSPLLLGYLLAPSAPIALIGITILVSFVPILWLLPPLIEPRFRLMLYCTVGVFVLNTLIAWLSFSPGLKREVQCLIIAVVVCTFAYLLRPSRLVSVPSSSRRRWAIVLAMRLAVAIMGLSLAANLFGYVKLSQFFAVACIYSTFVAISILTGVRVFTLLLLAGLESGAAERLAMIRHFRSTLCRWAPRLLAAAGILIWLYVTLDLFAVRDLISEAISDSLDFRILGSSSDVTLGGVLGFFVILLAGYAISSAIRFILREEILSHFHLARGVPELISTALHYMILVLVVLAALKAGHVELNKFTVLTGAIGVGVGFGLQNIINNFISGLILQFERPIHIGDVLELDAGAAGTVTRIGIRSSTILTAQGAEIIVPNSNFISNRVTNWTLTEAERRVELPVGVAYGTDLKLVMRLLYEAAATHESVLTQPPPVAYFKEFGDSSLNFELQFWVMMESNWVRVRSEVLFAVTEALDKAGIEIPFPQRDLRLRSIDPAAAAELLSPNGSGAAHVPAPDNGFETSPQTANAATPSPVK